MRAGSANPNTVAALTMAAHDMRGPLTNIALLLEAIETSCEAGDVARAASLARKGQTISGNLDELLDGMLERACTHGCPLNYETKRVDLRQIADRVCAQNLPMAEKRSVELNCFGLNRLYTTGCGELLFEALDNLVCNAAKFAPTGSSARVCVAAEDDVAMIRVTNQGVAMSELDMRRLFKPFTNTLKAARPVKSTELGLWIAQLVAVRHGGRITSRFDSEHVTFTLSLPRHFGSPTESIAEASHTAMIA